MTPSDQTIYTILLWAMPVLLAILGFVGALAVGQLMKLAKSMNELNLKVERLIVKHDNLEKRVEKLEA